MFEKQEKLILNDLLKNPESGLYQKECFLWMLRQEIYRVERMNQPLSVLLIEISNIKDILQNCCHIPLKKFIDNITRILERDFRKTDIKGWYDKNILAIIMPNTTKSGASIAYKKFKVNITKSLINKGIKSNNHFDKACSIYSYPDEFLKKNNFFEKQFKLKGLKQDPYIHCQEFFKYHSKSRVQHFLKRFIDLLGSIIGLICLLPVLSIIGFIIKLSSPGPIFFKQIRLGYHGIPFIFYKFRSMYYGVDDKNHREYVNELIQGNHEKINMGSVNMPLLKMINDSRITPFGNFLRRSSLDELPQLFNVIKGEMSLVGPRPPIPYEVEKYQNWHLKRILEVKPGITGLWQTNGRSRTTFANMVRMDIQYANNWSIGMDIKILFKTIKAVLYTNGAY